ncbi:putative transposase [Natrinema hispanicum]|uniref:Putative transposase n=1 Tax=Natrinema hispanicum TaxID=392421 RepID=A0A1G6YPH8_9EURY|nr:putative transposase [Natrinema hispanicum]
MLEPIEGSLEACFRDVCGEYDYEILSSSENFRFS